LIVVGGRLAQPEKNPDSMDIVLQSLGGALGFVMIRIFFSRKTLAPQPVRRNAFPQDAERKMRGRYKGRDGE